MGSNRAALRKDCCPPAKKISILKQFGSNNIYLVSGRVSQCAKLPETNFTLVISEQHALHEKASYEMTDFCFATLASLSPHPLPLRC